MRGIAIRSGFALACVLTGSALAAGHKHKGGSEVFTEPSGHRGSASVDLVTAPEFFGVRGIKLWDFDRRTCQLQLEQASLNAPGTAVLDAHTICEPKLGQSWKRADAGEGLFVTALAVCTTRSKSSPLPIRGVELWGASVGTSGKLAPARRPVRLEFAGCEKWAPKSACPAGAIATGVRAFTEGDMGAVGLGLRCHRIEAIP